jgi:hypothetical protein
MSSLALSATMVADPRNNGPFRDGAKQREPDWSQKFSIIQTLLLRVQLSIAT